MRIPGVRCWCTCHGVSYHSKQAKKNKPQNTHLGVFYLENHRANRETLCVQKYAVDGGLSIDATFAFFKNTFGKPFSHLFWLTHYCDGACQ